MAVQEHFGIGALSRRTGVKVETIRYYERAGLVPAPPRTAGNHRAYDEGHLKRIWFIRRTRQLGFSLEDVRGLLELVDGKPYTCGEVKSFTLSHAKVIREKIADLRRLERTLNEIASECPGGTGTDCPIIDNLLDSSTVSE